MIIDFHTHTFPDKVAPHAIAHMQSLNHCDVFGTGTVTGLLDSCQKSGVNYSVVLPVVTNPTKSTSINNVSIAHTQGDGLIYFGGIHPDTPDWHEELGRIAEAGIKGIKLHPHYQGVDLDDIRFLRILGRAAELGLIVVIHAGLEPAYPNDIRSSPQTIRKVVDQLDGLTLVAAHMGGMWEWDAVAEYLADTRVYIDTANALGHLAQTEEQFYTDAQAQLLTDEQFCRLVRLFGSQRILFGTDCPWTSQAASIERIRTLDLIPEEKENILGKNACRLLNIPG